MYSTVLNHRSYQQDYKPFVRPIPPPNNLQISKAINVKHGTEHGIKTGHYGFSRNRQYCETIRSTHQKQELSRMKVLDCFYFYRFLFTALITMKFTNQIDIIFHLGFSTFDNQFSCFIEAILLYLCENNANIHQTIQHYSGFEHQRLINVVRFPLI